MKEILKVGLAYKDNKCTGLGMKTQVKTIDQCTYVPSQQCQGEEKCEVQIKFEDSWCDQEIEKRTLGKTHYGTAKYYGLALCTSDTVLLGSLELSRSSASILVVSLDLLILLVFYLSIIRLQWYESLFERDMQEKAPMIEDFSIYLQDIPI